MAVWLGTILVIAVIWLIASIKVSPQFATGLAVIVLMLVPAWCNVEFLRLPFYVSHAATIVCLCMYCVHPKATFPLRLGIVDYFGLMFLATHLISDTLVEGWSWVFLLRAYTEWACPYIAGRLAFQKWSDVEKLVPFAVGAATILGIDSALESLTAVHPFEWIHGWRPDENFGRDTARWGLIRSWGTRSHAIYFGNVQLMLMAWSGYAAYKAIKRQWPAYAIIPFIVSCFGIFFTASRAPILGIGAFLAISTFFIVPKMRLPTAFSMAVLLIGVVVFWPTVKMVMNKTGRISTNRLQGPLIKQGGEYVEYSGSMTRWHEFQLYSPAVLKGGLFGYGSTATQDFPPRVGVQIEDVKALKHWKFVDNSYLLIALRFGWMGLISFVGLCLSAFLRLSFMTWNKGENRDVMVAMLASALGAMLLVVGTVWLAPDYQFVFFWLLGSASSTRPLQVMTSRSRANSSNRADQTESPLNSFNY
jgi:O-Antigen ligase